MHSVLKNVKFQSVFKCHTLGYLGSCDENFGVRLGLAYTRRLMFIAFPAISCLELFIRSSIQDLSASVWSRLIHFAYTDLVSLIAFCGPFRFHLEWSQSVARGHFRAWDVVVTAQLFSPFAVGAVVGLSGRLLIYPYLLTLLMFATVALCCTK